MMRQLFTIIIPLNDVTHELMVLEARPVELVMKSCTTRMNGIIVLLYRQLLGMDNFLH